MLEDQPQPSGSLSGLNSQEPRPSTSADLCDEPPTKRHRYVQEFCIMWNLIKLYLQLGTEEKAITFAEQRGMLPKSKMCSYHKQPMKLDYSTNKTLGSFRCYRGKCKSKVIVNRVKGTWFENIKIRMSQVFYLMYAYACKWSYDQTIKEDYSKNEHCLSRGTINDWFNYCREAVVIYQMETLDYDGKIGGPGKIVQIDKSKFGKRKYNKGHHIEGNWVLGMIENGKEDLRLELFCDNVCSAEVLVSLIQKHVAEGTTIHTDGWRAYDCLGDYGYIHKKINHSDPDNPFVGAEGTHTLRIEAQWRVIKRFFMKDNYNNFNNFSDLLYEYLWRRTVEKYKKDPFEEILNVVKHVYY